MTLDYFISIFWVATYLTIFLVISIRGLYNIFNNITKH